VSTGFFRPDPGAKLAGAAREQLEAEIRELRAHLLEAEETLGAIREGQVDAVVVTEHQGDRVYTLQSPDRPYRLMIEEMRQGAVTVTPEGVVLYCNGCFAEMMRIDAARAAGSSVRSLVDPASRDLFDALLRQEDKIQGEIDLCASDGAVVPALVAVNALDLDGARVLCLVITDLTEQKRGEQMVADERLARSILDQATEAMVVCDRRGRILRANREAHRLCGRSPLLEPFEIAFPLDLHARDLADARAFLDSVLGGERLRGIEADLRCDETALSLSAGPLLGPEDRVEGCVVTLTDISERKRTEREMERARAAAEAMNTAKDQFLATLSHELRTPLTPVLAVISGLEQSDRLSSEIRDDFVMMRRNIELEARLIDDLLDLTRISRGKLELDRHDLDLRAVLEHAVQTSCGEEIASGRRGVELDLAAADHRLWGDGPRLTQVFWNLLNNAVKFTPEGGTVRVRSRAEGDGAQRLVVEVSDTGVGIEPEVLPRIFDAFEQGEVSVTRRFGGLGLGLAITKAIVGLHGGDITALSEGRDRGATFVVSLPVGPRPLHLPAPDERREEAASVPQPARRILLVEDHADTAEALAELLRGRGHEVTVAGSVERALATAEEMAKSGPDALDLVISDLGLPDGSGQELMRELASRFGLHGIALSGYGMEEDVRRSHEAGFDRHLTKPVNLQALESAIQQVAGAAAPDARKE
jgi:PAS domain S-box-containing protein